MKKITLSIVFALVFLMLLAVPASAFNSFQTYTYSINGDPLYSPDAYIPVATYNSTHMGLETALSSPNDMVVDEDMNVYIADMAANTIVVLDRYYKHKFTISSFTNEIGAPDKLNSPRGVFVTKNKYNGYGELVEAGRIYVCDTLNYRLVVFDRQGNFLYVLDAPESQLIEDNDIYRPVAVAVDKYNRIYVVSDTTTDGIIVLTEDGEFTGFIGAQKVSISLWDIIWRRFQTADQKKLSSSFVPVTFSNITVSEDDFIYATSNKIDESKVASAIRSKSKSGDNSSVKMLNAAGAEIMRRNGFYPPLGEISYISSTNDTSYAYTGVSTVGDVALGEASTWSISDTKRSKVFTYDFEGNLLFAFGDMGNQQLGNIGYVQSIAYQGDKLLILDSGTTKNITVYERTEYGEILYQAVSDQINREYDKSIENWTEILMRNSNFDAAYIGIGQALYRSGQYAEAIEYYKAAYDTSNYSNAFVEIRKNTIEDYFALIPLAIIALCVAVVFVSKKITKINVRAATSGEKITFGKELLYGFHVIMHPFDGFWDLKHEKRGSVRASLVFIAVTVATFYYQSIGQGYLFNPRGYYSTIFTQLVSVLVPVLLFITANWCLTTLMEGEGSFKDIFVAVSYSLVPAPLFIIPATILSNMVAGNEQSFVNLLVSLAFVWAGFLIFFGTMVTHDYSLGKNVLTTILTIVGMVFIMFVALLFTTLLGKIVGFVSNIITEISYRL
ncbi:MAG: YIP1 family protein [Clostridia bacterium]|nr:YIP1 family protein [Clostridia bacterium]